MEYAGSLTQRNKSMHEFWAFVEDSESFNIYAVLHILYFVILAVTIIIMRAIKYSNCRVPIIAQLVVISNIIMTFCIHWKFDVNDRNYNVYNF